jgi:hypothetical protein
MRIDPFVPYASANLAVTSASASQALTAGSCVRLTNNGSVPVLVKFGAAGVVATVTDLCLMPGASEVFGVNPNPVGPITNNTMGPTTIAAITASGTSTLNIVTGEGV